MFDKNLVHAIIGGEDLDCGRAQLPVVNLGLPSAVAAGTGRQYPKTQCWQDRRSAWKNTSIWYSTTAPNRITFTGRWWKEPCQDLFTLKFKRC